MQAIQEHLAKFASDAASYTLALRKQLLVYADFLTAARTGTGTDALHTRDSADENVETAERNLRVSGEAFARQLARQMNPEAEVPGYYANGSHLQSLYGRAERDNPHQLIFSQTDGDAAYYPVAAEDWLSLLRDVPLLLAATEAEAPAPA